MKSSRNRNALLLCFLAYILQSSNALLCDPVEPSWDGFISALQNSFGGFAVLCPFTIQGEGCPTKEDHDKIGLNELQAGTQLYVLCYSLFGGSEDTCVIDCPGTQLVVPSYTRLEFDRFTFQGSSNSSAIKVKPDGELALYNSILKNNGNADVNGGAILAEESSFVTISNCHFQNNTANCGGALHTHGSAEIQDSTFNNNRAMSQSSGEGGGAIYIGQNAEAEVTNSVFLANEATYLGPALLDQSTLHGASITNEENTACHNLLTSTGSECNGNHIVFSYGIVGTLCLPFENACAWDANLNNNNATDLEIEFRDSEDDEVSPTSFPTTDSPTAVPTSVPTSKPSAVPTSPRPTHAPSSSPVTAFPTLQPTILPTTAPTTVSPTSAPTPSPTRAPTAGPTQTTAIPTLEPTHAPSASPMTSSPTWQPTALPTSVPTFSPTAEPTAVPASAPTPLPTRAPTEGPTRTTATPTTIASTVAPTLAPITTTTEITTEAPIYTPTTMPTHLPTHLPTQTLTQAPTPTIALAATATELTTAKVTEIIQTSPPTDTPTHMPTRTPTNAPTEAPTAPPTNAVDRLAPVDEVLDLPVNITTTASCSAHPRCAVLSLMGNCCPTDYLGISLYCCD